MLGRETPIKSADSRRVETDERRRWWELRFAPEIELRMGDWERESFMDVVETEVGREGGGTETELLREWEREWRDGRFAPEGAAGLPKVKAFI